jgi:predicted transposase YbfD/YdcC
MVATHVGLLKKHFRSVKDARVRGRTRHLLFDIIAMAICAVIGDCENWLDIETFVKKRESWFKRFLKLPHGVPSHDTFERVFASIDARVFERCCVQWLRQVATLVGLGHIAIDGKTLCGSANSELGMLHVVSAWATKAHLLLGQVAVDGKSNEITAIPKLLELLDLKGALVTIDAMGCQKEIAAQIIDQGGDYLLAVKGNQEHLLQDVKAAVTDALDKVLVAGNVDIHEHMERRKGRQVDRCCVVVRDLSGIRDRKLWAGLTTVGMCCTMQTIDGHSYSEIRYFIGSRIMSARGYAKGMRSHWGIENNQHWHLRASCN